MKLTLTPLELRQANEFYEKHHRHHGKVQQHRWSCGVVDEMGVLMGAYSAGRPRARLSDTRKTEYPHTIEVIRLCTHSKIPTPGAASMMYGSAWRAAKAKGFKRAITFILKEEAGTSLKASNWRYLKDSGGGTWSRPKCGRNRKDKHPTGAKEVWIIGEE